MLHLEEQVQLVAEPTHSSNAIWVIDQELLDANQISPGTVDSAVGRAAFVYLQNAVAEVQKGRFDGLVTLPISKEATNLTVPGFNGHTDSIAKWCQTENYAMMLATQEVAVSHVSAHMSLKDAIQAVKVERIEKVITLTYQALRKFLANPRIAVCGLNPHAGESGLFGTEEKHIASAIEITQSNGIDTTGPLPADTVFYQAIHQDRFDAIVAMYHDQGHAPMKLFAFERGVNVTIGLPIVRTSVDHGTAFDIAWQGKAFTQSLLHAIAYAEKLIGKRSSPPN